MNKMPYIIALFFVYFSLQLLVEHFELIYQPLIPQVLFFFCGLLVIYIRISVKERRECFFVLHDPIF